MSQRIEKLKDPIPQSTKRYSRPMDNESIKSSSGTAGQSEYPSFNDLLEMLTEFRTKYSDISTQVLEHFDGSAVSYWLYGQVQIGLDTPITPELIRSASEIHQQRQQEYGPPCNFLETASMERGERDFSELKVLIQKWSEIKFSQ